MDLRRIIPLLMLLSLVGSASATYANTYTDGEVDDGFIDFLVGLLVGMAGNATNLGAAIITFVIISVWLLLTGRVGKFVSTIIKVFTPKS